jgi:hypothetical protein
MAHIVQVREYSFNVTSLFLGIQRATLYRIDWQGFLRTGRELCIPCRMLGLQNLSGRVLEILYVSGGKLVCLQPTYGSLLQDWRCFWVWIPYPGGSGGVLNRADAPQKHSAITRALRGTTISVGQAIDNGWMRYLFFACASYLAGVHTKICIGLQPSHARRINQGLFSSLNLNPALRESLRFSRSS